MTRPGQPALEEGAVGRHGETLWPSAWKKLIVSGVLQVWPLLVQALPGPRNIPHHWLIFRSGRRWYRQAKRSVGEGLESGSGPVRRFLGCTIGTLPAICL